ncbi:3-hydroxybutyryl-CoA dehydrogenase [bacterium AH-315-J21]|nr:3-hydroxybutyryl-CoA dehydrogenase [bacterium AH-315-J21]
MKIEDIKTVGVIGAGTMGNGIAHVFAQSGFKVVLCDKNESSLEKAIATITKNLDRQLKKERITAEQKSATLANLTTVTELSGCAECQLVVEAVFENLEVKSAIFAELGKVLSPDSVLASNTSSLPITQLASTTGRADKFIGMHFMNPVPIMKLVELIRGLATSDETFDLIYALCEKLGKQPVEVNDYPGFVANRILMPMINEAAYTMMEGVAGAEEIDKVMMLGMNHPMGPLTLADFIGLDVCLAIMETLHEGYGDSKYRPCPLLRKMVQAGYLGRKSGRGFHNYEK